MVKFKQFSAKLPRRIKQEEEQKKRMMFNFRVQLVAGKF